MLYGTAEESGGKNIYASEDSAERNLNLFFTEYSQRGCSVDQATAVVGIVFSHFSSCRTLKKCFNIYYASTM